MNILNLPTRQQRRAAERKQAKAEKAEIAARRAKPPALPILPPSNKINIYDCGTHENVTVDRFVGVTPMMIHCPHCKKPALSRWYKVDQTLVPELEWTQPEPKELGRLPRALVEHLVQGGLMLKKIKT